MVKTIFSLALARDETRLARGDGLSLQAHALAFSPDGSRIAAANLWGGLCVWNVADGREIGRKPEESGRKTRSLTYPEAAPDALFPVMLSDSIVRPIARALAPNGQVVAIQRATVEIRKFRRSVVLARFDPAEFEIAKTGVRRVAWSADSKALALTGDGWVGAWLPFEPKPTLFAAALPTPETPSALAVLRGLGESWEVLYACDHEVVRLLLVTPPEVCRPTKWQEFLSRVPELADEASRPRSSWRWNETSSGYDGVDLRSVDLLWYHESRPAWAGEWGEEQSLDSFLAEGPRHPIPEPLLIELCQAVRQIVAAARANEIPSNGVTGARQSSKRRGF